jgi:hypothetical protein
MGLGQRVLWRTRDRNNRIFVIQKITCSNIIGRNYVVLYCGRVSTGQRN